MITPDEYQKRRLTLASHLVGDCVAIIPAAREVMRNGDTHYRFRQDSYFYYLTGFDEPDALLVMTSGPLSQTILFNRPNNPSEEQWTGKRLGQDQAPAALKIDIAYPISELTKILPTLLSGKQAIYYTFNCDRDLDACVLSTWQQLKLRGQKGMMAPQAIYDLQPLISEMRLIKSPAECDLMRKAAQVTVFAHERAMRACKGLTHEYALEAELIYSMTQHGCRNVAYDSIVANGKNACVLHYTANNQALDKNALVLVDAGAEYEYYASDVTRTYPTNGRFSTEQRLIYELVLSAQQAGIACIKPGCLWPTIQTTIVRVLTTGLVSLGLLKGDVDELLNKKAYLPFYMHNSGHWLGLDVHDCGRYKTNGVWRELEPGMVLTVEPGLYMPDWVNTRFANIGVRIEDDILVTETGYENLTKALPVNVDDIERFIRG